MQLRFAKWWLWAPKASNSQDDEMTMPISTGERDKSPSFLVFQGVTVTPDTPAEAQAKSLLKEATVKHDAGDLPGAITCLREAYALMDYSASYPIKTYLRLPLYLQKAGEFDVAMIAFNDLLLQTPKRIARAFAHQPANAQKKLVAKERSVINDSIRVARERERKRQEKMVKGKFND